MKIIIMILKIKHRIWRKKLAHKTIIYKIDENIDVFLSFFFWQLSAACKIMARLPKGVPGDIIRHSPTRGPLNDHLLNFTVGA